MTAAPPSTRMSVTETPAALVIASTTSRVWKAIDSTTARAMWALVVPRVMPRIAPRAYGSHHGLPSPVNAGTTTTPPVLATDSASGPICEAWSMMLMPSRSHWMALPVTKIAPSSAYVVSPVPKSHATVVSIPSVGCGHVVPTFISTKLPVPYVFLLLPVSKHA